MDTAVAILALGPSGKLPLDHFKGLWVDDGLMVILHVVLRDLTLIGFHLLGQEVLAEGFLQQGILKLLVLVKWIMLLRGIMWQQSIFRTHKSGVALFRQIQ